MCCTVWFSAELLIWFCDTQTDTNSGTFSPLAKEDNIFTFQLWSWLLYLKLKRRSLLRITLGPMFYALCSVSQSCPTLCDPMDCSPLGSPLWGFSRQEYWSGLPCPPPGNLPNLGIKPRSPTLQEDSLPTEPPEKIHTHTHTNTHTHTHTHVYISEEHCCTPETNTTL